MLVERPVEYYCLKLHKWLQADRDTSHLELSRKYEASPWAQKVDHMVTLASQSGRSPSVATAQQLHMPASASTRPLAAAVTLMKVNVYSHIHFFSTLAYLCSLSHRIARLNVGMCSTAL